MKGKLGVETVQGEKSRMHSRFGNLWVDESATPNFLHALSFLRLCARATSLSRPCARHPSSLCAR